MTKVVAATPEVLDTLRKARNLVNKENLSQQSLNAANELANMSVLENGTLFPAKIKSGNGLIGYTCDIYENGISQDPTSEGIVYLTNGASTFYVLPPRNNHFRSSNASKFNAEVRIKMISALSYYINQHMFFQIPLPLIIGNLPAGDFLNHKDEYEYLKLYKVPYDNYIIYWSKFENNYIMRKLDNIEDMFPQLKIRKC